MASYTSRIDAEKKAMQGRIEVEENSWAPTLSLRKLGLLMGSRTQSNSQAFKSRQADELADFVQRQELDLES